MDVFVRFDLYEPRHTCHLSTSSGLGVATEVVPVSSVMYHGSGTLAQPPFAATEHMFCDRYLIAMPI